ncbi:MAG TPA: GAF domain-containing protein, partial [Candidatus Binatia bacterium]|nr:GAF domain-containing protein [Candidatus Binatia bacterium]
MPSSKDSIVSLKKTIAAQAREIREGQEQQAATSAILRIIARAPADLQKVLNTIAESAARLCNAADALVWRVDGTARYLAAHFGSLPLSAGVGADKIQLARTSPPGRAILNRETVHVHDLRASSADFVGARTRSLALGVRTTVVTPLLRDGIAIGAVQIRRTEVRPFTDVQIRLLETFADQAVIAIENARLIHEQQASNRDLIEALQQQTATSEILRVIASSPTDIQPVLDAIAESAARLCGSDDAQIYRVETDLMRKVASFGVIPSARLVGDTRTIARGTVTGRAILDRRIIHIPDMMKEREEDYPEARRIDEEMGIRTSLAVPLLREGIAVGVILIRRTEVCPFNDKQIALLKTFADQAVIAIENVRLFQELQARNRDVTEALEQQTATGEVLRVIASSPTDLQPVLDTLIANAARLCGATMGHVRQFDGEFHRVVAHYGETP